MTRVFWTYYTQTVQVLLLQLRIGSAVMVVAITMVTIMIMLSPVAVVVILAVPMSLMHPPAFPVVVIVRMAPVGPLIRRMFPASSDPPVMVTHWCFISVHPE